MPKERPLRDALLAVSLMTVIPTGVHPKEGERTHAAGWFPLAGALVGGVAYVLLKIADAYGAPYRAPAVVASALVIAMGLVTRFLHWDGLADVGDAFWGSHDRERRLDIMADSHTGAFGATTVALVALLEVSAIATIIITPHESPLLMVPVLARFSATWAAWFGRPARPGGLGDSVIGRPSVLSAIVAGTTLVVALGGLWLMMGATGVVLGIVGMLMALAIPHLLSLRFGGVTGDVMGASILLTEALLFAAFALVGE